MAMPTWAAFKDSASLTPSAQGGVANLSHACSHLVHMAVNLAPESVQHFMYCDKLRTLQIPKSLLG